MFASRTLSLAAAVAAFPVLASGQVATQTVDFDETTVGEVFTFISGGDISGSITAAGNPGLAGSVTLVELERSNIGMPIQPIFAGGGIGGFDLASLLGVTAGEFTSENVGAVVVSFDILTSAGAGANSLRLDAGGTDAFLEAVTLAQEFETNGVFESASFTLGETAGFDSFLRRLNDTESNLAGLGGLVTFQTSISAASDGFFVEGDTVAFDNVVLTNPNAPIPEPATAALLGLGAAALLGRRRSR